jgi:para-nitrobenzyl esterase
MVFIHGGGFGWGGTSDPLYNGHNFVKNRKDIIFVTIAYRVGMLGFIDLTQIKGGENYKESPNLGLLDQVQALKWINKNIENFGGDKNNVTIVGESAGGAFVTMLPFIKGTKGLFKRIISQSGSFAWNVSREYGKV